MKNDFQFDSLIKQMAQDHQPQLPNPGLIWWRAQILRKQADKERIERPMVIMRMVAVTVCVATFVGMLTTSLLQAQPTADEAHLSSLAPLLVMGSVGCAIILALLIWSPASKT